MSKEMKSAYSVLYFKDGFAAWASRLFKAAVLLVAMIVLSVVVAHEVFGISVPSWCIHVPMSIALVCLLLHYGCHLASWVCENMIERLGFSEVELERLSCHL